MVKFFFKFSSINFSFNIILILGTEAECLEKESELVDYFENDHLKKNIHKGQNSKKTEERICEIRASNELDLLKTKVAHLESKLKEKELEVDEKTNIIDELKKKNEELLKSKKSNFIKFNLI